MNTEMVSGAELPVLYTKAVNALAECSSIDECLVWADKSKALASYAKQIEDKTLMNHATRIHARAIRGAGKLIEDIEPKHGANQNIREGDRPNVTRESAATDAGMSSHQRKTALRVANVPESEFERQVESEKPPTVTMLAEQGIKPSAFRKSTEAVGHIRRFSKWIELQDSNEIANGMFRHEVQPTLEQTDEIIEWLQSLRGNLCIRHMN